MSVMRAAHVGAEAEKRLAARQRSMAPTTAVVVGAIAALAFACVALAVHAIALVDGVLLEHVAFVGGHFNGRV